MYSITRVEDTIRILPDKFGEDLDEVIKESVQKTFEGTVRKDHGIIVVAQNIKPKHKVRFQSKVKALNDGFKKCNCVR